MMQLIREIMDPFTVISYERGSTTYEERVCIRAAASCKTCNVNFYVRFWMDEAAVNDNTVLNECHKITDYLICNCGARGPRVCEANAGSGEITGSDADSEDTDNGSGPDGVNAMNSGHDGANAMNSGPDGVNATISGPDGANDANSRLNVNELNTILNTIVAQIGNEERGI